MSKQFEMVQRSSDHQHYKILSEYGLLSFLYEALADRSRNSVKSILRRGQVFVNNKPVTQFNHLIKNGDHVQIVKNEAAKRKAALVGLRILFEDRDILVIHKEAGLLSVAASREDEITAHAQLMAYVKDQHPKNRIYIVHRLDRETSGVMLFAKSEQVKHQLQDNWHDVARERTYIALVEGQVEKDEGTITSFLKETATHVVYSSKSRDGLRAVTHYKKIRANQAYSLLEVALETGRKNQIRVHMQDIGHPVVGDKKYGSTKNPIKRLGLHAQTLAFYHPRTHQWMRLVADVPNDIEGFIQ